MLPTPQLIRKPARKKGRSFLRFYAHGIGSSSKYRRENKAGSTEGDKKKGRERTQRKKKLFLNPHKKKLQKGKKTNRFYSSQSVTVLMTLSSFFTTKLLGNSLF